MLAPSCPALFQINTRVWLTELSRTLGRAATLDDIPDAELDQLAALGFDWVWFLSVWQTGPAGRHVSRTHAEWRRLGDLIGGAVYERDGDELEARRLYLDLEPWQHHVFDLEAV